jgi:hypothetical protein
MQSITRFVLGMLAIAWLLTQASTADTPIKHRLLLTEYGKGSNRFVELDADGKQL